MTILKGVEGDRAKIRGAALHIIRSVLEIPDAIKKRSTDIRRDWLAPPPLSAFRRLEPIGFDLSDDEDEEWFFHPQDCPPDLVWPLDVGIITKRDDAPYAMSRTRTVSMRDVRGIVHRFSPFMVRADFAQVFDHELERAAMVFAWLGGRWVGADNRTLWIGRAAEYAIPEKAGVDSAEDCENVNMAISVALRQRYEWAVSLGLENSPTVRFATDPTGIKDVFRIRDLPEGKDRREALLTWVTDHWRQDRHDPDLEIYVRKHLRGATAFTWRNMLCELTPSQYDMDQRMHFIDERNKMRMTSTDKRQRDNQGKLHA